MLHSQTVLLESWLATMLLESLLVCGLLLLVCGVYKYIDFYTTMDTIVLVCIVYLQILLCSLPTVEELWHQRTCTHPFLWKL